jgi:hypothetical protein
MLRSLKVDVKVQQELLRHADIRTTMNLYTQAIPDDMREANSKVARMVLLGNPGSLTFPHQTVKQLNGMRKAGERGRNRTFNLLIKSQLLCQLSYAPVS